MDRIKNIWYEIRKRTRKDNKDHRNYYDKGIRVCDEWMNNFSKFKEWALTHGYEDDLSIDRIDGTKGYEPSNCRWATVKQQANNKCTNRRVTVNGESHTVSEWAEITGLRKSTILYRLNNKWATDYLFKKANNGEKCPIHAD